MGPKTKRTLLVAIQVSGVRDIAVEEALWLAVGLRRSLRGATRLECVASATGPQGV